MGEKSEQFWDKIDAILIINLAHRTDRFNRLYDFLKGIGVESKVHRIDAVDGKTLNGYKQHPWFTSRTPKNVAQMKAGSAGCCMSHRKTIAYAKQHHFKNILILEDDAIFRNDLKGRQGEMIAEVMSQDSEWDMIYLGFYQRLNKHYVAKQELIDGKFFDLWRIRGPLFMHAIVMNYKIFDVLLDELPSEKKIWSWMTYWGSIDSWIYNKFGRNSLIKIWGTNPNLVVQTANDYSDICGRSLSVEESEGTHRTVKMIPLNYDEFIRSMDLTIYETCYQFFKRGGRIVRTWMFGYKKT